MEKRIALVIHLEDDAALDDVKVMGYEDRTMASAAFHKAMDEGKNVYLYNVLVVKAETGN